MKHKITFIYTILLFAVLWCCAGTLSAADNVSYLSSIGIKDREVVKKGREVQVSMHMDFSDLKIKTQHSVALTPVLVSSDGKHEQAFPPVVLDGKTRNRMYMRAQKLESVDLPPYHNGEAQAIIRRNNRKDQSYDYQASAPYQRWMLDGRIELREEVHGCVNCAKGNSTQPMDGTVLPKYIPDYKYTKVAPDPEPVKVRAESRTARLQFRQDSYTLDPKFRGNQAELDTVVNSFELVKNNADLSITGVYLTGYASPEGTVAYNLKLSENRALALANYITKQADIDKELMHVDWKGEDWVGLRAAVEDCYMLLKKDEVLRIIDECDGDRDVCEEKLKQLIPETIYERLLNEVYPVLRRNEYRIVYNVRNFDMEEARRMIVERPDLLSLTEMYKVASSYEKGSADYERVMATAAKYFPETPAVVNDRALEAMEDGRYAEAVKILEAAKVTQTNGVLLNTLGMAYAGAEEPYKAQDAFERAQKAGSQDAAHNLEEIAKVIDQL